MQRCPPEICAQIYSLACGDDGSTGRSLSLVSRYIHDTSSHLKYQSLAVRGPQQTIALASLLENTPPNLRRISDLSISIDLRYSPAEEKACTERMAASMSSALTKMSFFLRSLRSGYRTRDNWKDELAKEVRKKAEERFYEAARLVEKQAAAAFLRILELVSPSLQTLSVSFRDMALPPSFAAGGLPKLRELTIAHGGGSLFGPDTVSHCALCSVDAIPSLRRLNLQLFDVICTPRWLIRHVAIFAPNITHLRLPVVYGSWEQALNPNEPHPDGGDKPLLPTTIQKILVQPCLPAGYMSGNGWLFYKSGLDQYRSLAKKDNRIVVLQPANWDGDKLSDDGELNTEWLDRLNGGNGCWKTDGRLLRT